MQRCPFKKARFIQEQTDNNNSHERSGSVPDDLPDHRYVAEAHYAESQRKCCADQSAPANVQAARLPNDQDDGRSEKHTSELQSLMRNSYAVFCLKKKKKKQKINIDRHTQNTTKRQTKLL